jgi:DNA polymerase-3 subunit gamma/tau
MNYEVTAIRKRPQTFDELVGQEFVVTTIKNALQSNHIGNAYLFSGPRGVGKTSAARILAKALNCATGITASPCGQCDACREITAGHALDVIEIDGASHTGVNDIREIRDEVLFTPSSFRYKIYIIDEVHMLSNSAFNALLKTIEEPPPYVVFIFATTEIHKVPATIRSRCQQYTFQLFSLNDLMKLLSVAAKESGVTIDSESLVWIAKEATGSCRDAYTLFDQIASMSENQITIKKIQEKMGLVGVEEMTKLIGLLAKNRIKEALESLNGILQKGIAEEQVLVGLAEYFRLILLLQNGITKESILGTTKESFPDEILTAYTVPQTEKALELILELLRNFRFSLNQHFELELLVHRLASLSSFIPQVEILKRLERLKNEIAEPGQTEEEPLPPRRSESADDAPDDVPEETAVEGAAPGEMTGPRIVKQITETIGRKKLALASALGKHRTAELKNNELTIIFNDEDKFSAEFVGKEKGELTQVAEQILSRPIAVKIVYAQRKDKTEPAQDESETIIKKVFKGSVVKGE